MRNDRLRARPVLPTKTKLAVARALSRAVVLVRRALGRDAITVARRSGLLWELDLNEGIDLSIYLLGSFERNSANAYKRLVPPGATVLDIGANIGAHTLPLANQVGPQGRVIAFEATDFALTKLRRNLELNPRLVPSVVEVHALLAGPNLSPPHRSICASWPLGEAPDRHPVHGGRTMSTDGAKVTTLDAALDELCIEHIDFIKIDTDGHEVDILEGSTETIRRSLPPILTEVAPHALAAAGRSLEALLQTFEGHGYELYEPSSGARLHVDTAALLARIPHGASIDLLAQARPGPR